MKREVYILNIDRERVNRLKEYVQGVLDNKDGRNLYFTYIEDIEKVTPQECFEIFYSKLEKGYTPKEILEILDKTINVFYISLSTYEWERPKENSFLSLLIKENKGLEKKLENIRAIIMNKEVGLKKEELLKAIGELESFNDHYLKKENILFPYMEKKMESFEGLTIMWSLHDEARDTIKRMIEVLETEDFDDSTFNIEVGRLFFTLLGIVNKEDLILFPAATEVIEDSEWEEMNAQSLEYDFPFIERPVLHMKKETEKLQSFQGMTFKTDTGELDFEQMLLILNALPVDLSFVDENNKVRFFTRPKDRIFPRSPAVIGRDVKNCHPSESVHVVEEIIKEFKAGNKDKASFWINLKGKMILIQYFALRNSLGEYKGVLEVSQDITDIQKLEGEKRLLEW